jgi:hypothetical protein
MTSLNASPRQPAWARLAIAGLALCLVASPALSQSRGKLGGKAKPRGGFAVAGVEESPRVALAYEGDDIEGLAAEFELDLLAGNERKQVFVTKTKPGTTPSELGQLLAQLGTADGVLFAEEDLRVDLPNVKGCSLGKPPGEVQPQQCTVGVVDGDPTDAKYSSQRMLDQISAQLTQRLPRIYTPVVAVIDTGIDPGHSVFKNKVFKAGYDFVEMRPRGFEIAEGEDEDGDGLIDEAYGHGTHIAGTVLAVDPFALILPVKAMTSDGTGFAFDVAQAIFYSVDQGADIINLSLSLDNPTKTVVSALQYAEAKGVAVYTSAGNTGGLVLFPGNYDASEWPIELPILAGTTLDGAEIVTVTAVDPDDVKADFSAWGPDVDVSAPGVGIYSAYPGEQWAWYDGTSMATAVASGAAALLLGIGGPVTPSNALLEENADAIDDLNPAYEGGLGTGRIDALAAGKNVFFGLDD